MKFWFDIKYFLKERERLIYFLSIWYGFIISCSFVLSYIEYFIFGNNLCNRSFGICKKMYKCVI